MEAANEELLAISEDLMAKEKALFSEKVFSETLLESIPGLFYVYDDRRNLIRWNKNHEKMTGYSAEELSDVNLLSWFDEHDSVKIGAVYEEVINTGYGEVEAYLNTRGGEQLYIHFNNVRMTIDEKTYFLGVGIDISERKKAEDTVKNALLFQQILMDAVPLPVYYKNTDCVFMGGNKAFEKYLGLSPEQYIGKTWYDFAPAELAAVYDKTDREMLENPGVKIYEPQMITADGQLHDIISSKSLFMDTEDKVAGLICVVNDITERKKMEKALSEEKEKYRLLVANSHDIIYTHTLDGIFTFVSPSWTKVLGHPEDHVVGHSFREFVHPDNVPDIITRTKRVVETGIIQGEVSYRIRHVDGTWRWHTTNVSLLKDDSGRIIGIQGSARDITERKQAEDKIQSLLAEKELILREVHHRIKNFMNTIKGLILLQLDSVKEPSAVSALQDVESRIFSMIVLYDKLYNADNYNDLSVADFIPSLMDEIMAIFPNNDSVKTEKNIDYFVLDSKKLQPLGIIINELLTNIMKHAFKGRNDGLITVSATSRDNHVSLVIRDNGIGIPESVGFENSIGFGMQLVSMLTEQIDGSIRIERGEGTKFVLEFDI